MRHAAACSRRCAFNAATPASFARVAQVSNTGASRSTLPPTNALTSSRTSFRRRASTRSTFVNAIAPRWMPSSSTIARCSRVCGITPSSAAITSSAKSMPLAPAVIVCTSLSWPGTSIRPSTSPLSSGT
jgi:hypothetical protein